MAKTDKSEIAEAMGVMPMHVDLTSDRFPEIKDWKIGSEYTVTVTGKLKSIGENYDGKGLRACLEVAGSKKDDDEEYDD